MTRSEFAAVMAYLAKGVGIKQTDPDQAEVYFDLVGDLPAPLVREASRRVLLEHRYPSIPPVGAIRQQAVALQQSDRATGPAAWEQILAAVRRYGRAHEARGLASLPADVAQAARTFGWGIICDATNDELGIVQTQFLKVYETLARRSERQAIMPPISQAAAAICGDIGRSLDEATELVKSLTEKT